MHCLKTYGLDARAIDYVCFSNLGSPASETREDLLNYYARGAGSWRELLRAGDLPGVATRFVGMLPHSVEEVGRAWWSSRKSAASNLAVERQLARFGLDGIPISRFHHHSNHAASAYYALCKNWQEPHLVFTLDGGGDDACAHIYLAQEGELRLLAATPTGHSLGNIYASVTFMLGMRPHEHEYKVMGLAPYADAEQGREVAKSFAVTSISILKIHSALNERSPNGRVRFCRDCCGIFAGALRLTGRRVTTLHGGPDPTMDWSRRAQDGGTKCAGGRRRVYERESQPAHRSTARRGVF